MDNEKIYVSAGRIVPLPKGSWIDIEEYRMLDMVSHKNIIYLAKKTSINQEPQGVDDDYWMVMINPYNFVQDKADGPGIGFEIIDDIPYMTVDENHEMAAMLMAIYDDDPTNDAQFDAEVHDIVEKVYDDDPGNDVSASYPDIDKMIENIYG